MGEPSSLSAIGVGLIARIDLGVRPIERTFNLECVGTRASLHAFLTHAQSPTTNMGSCRSAAVHVGPVGA